MSLPSGYTFLSGSLYLGSNLIFNIAQGTTLLGSTSWSAYPMGFYSRYSGTMGYGHASLLNAGVCLNVTNSPRPGDNCYQWQKIRNLIIEGGGVIDGQGVQWWAQCRTSCPDGSGNGQRPTLLGLLWVNGLTISNLTLMNSPFWTVHPVFSNNVRITGLYIDAPFNSLNTDGLLLTTHH